jgi:hypothetical protein
MPFFLAAFFRTIEVAIWATGKYALEAIDSGREPDWEEFAATLPRHANYSFYKGINMKGEILEQLRGKIDLTLIAEILSDVIGKAITQGIDKYGEKYDAQTSTLISFFLNDSLPRILRTWAGNIALDQGLNAAIDFIIKWLTDSTYQLVPNQHVLSDHDWNPYLFDDILRPVIAILKPLLNEVAEFYEDAEYYSKFTSPQTHLIPIALKFGPILANELIGVPDAIAKHSIALLAFSQYAEDSRKQGRYLNWDGDNLGDIAFSAVSSPDIAKAAAKGSTYAQSPDIDLDGTLRNVIAYSALVGDDVPFGDVGMQAWFSDMHDLGTVIKFGDVNQIFKEKFSLYGLFTIGGGGDPHPIQRGTCLQSGQRKE